MKAFIINAYFFILFLFLNTASIAQKINGCMFLKGNFVEIGIAPNGGFGTPQDAPAGYNARPAFGTGGPNMYNPTDGTIAIRPKALGFVADWDLNGFNNGSPAFIGDYFMPGTVQEGWGIDINGDRHNAYTVNYATLGTSGFVQGGGATSGASFTGVNTTLVTSPTNIIANWKGTYGSPTKLDIEQQTSLRLNKSYFVMKVKIKNVSASTVTNVFYTRTVDPDNDQAISGGSSFNTRNKIAYQLPNAANKVLVTAEGVVNPMAYLGLGSRDCRATAFIRNTGLFPADPLPIIQAQAQSGYIYTGGNQTDACIGIVFKLGDIAPGDSVLFAYAYVLNELDLDEAFNETSTGFDIGSTFVTNNGTFTQAFGSSQNICVSNAQGFTWQWFLNGAPTPVATGTCFSNTATLVNQTLTAVGTPSATGPCPIIAGGGSNVTLTLNISPIVVIPPPPTVTTPINYCLGNAATPLQATAETGNNLYWYTTAVGGTALPTAPTPSTTTSGTTSYYVSQGNLVIFSTRAKIDVIVSNLPTLTANITSNNKCFADSLQLNAISSNVTYAWSPSLGASITNAATINVAPPTNTTYTVQVTNAAGCKNMATVNTIVNPLPTLNITTLATEICLNDSTQLIAQGTPANYVWSPTLALNTTTGATVYAKPKTTTVIKVIATNSFGCKNTDSININVLPLPMPNLGPDVTICDTSSIAFTPGIFDNYLWQDASLNPTFIAKNIGMYNVIVTGVNGCLNADTVKLLGFYPLPKKFLPADQQICSNLTLTLSVPNYRKYLWSNNDTTNTIKVLGANLIKLLVTDNNNCTGADTINITSKYCIDFAVPNSFTPNADGKNDVFRPTIFETNSNYSFIIYNRWGKQIFATTQLAQGWDGTINGTKQPTDSYIYVVKYIDVFGKLKQQQGTATLIR